MRTVLKVPFAQKTLNEELRIVAAHGSLPTCDFHSFGRKPDGPKTTITQLSVEVSSPKPTCVDGRDASEGG